MPAANPSVNRSNPACVVLDPKANMRRLDTLIDFSLPVATKGTDNDRNAICSGKLRPPVPGIGIEIITRLFDATSLG
jgi:hypothetical protein